ncbi:hypothetical protein [Micromonospora craniellae]|uniref:Uncharacterized protein n=1 Tax=Micromonospora craniellae TaxID=2294034 RepID=A0A372FXV0_9ACTN|nr:hypothetical protein [Micromonospora craniellae]RFS45563.1 hypothetical protein D0Q02_15785 [Micromonospora craniellae]
MSNDFLVQNSLAAELNAELRVVVQDIGVIIDDVNRVLATMPEAAQTDALSPWADLKNAWTGLYADMQMATGTALVASSNAHEAYKWGNSQSVRAML